MTSYLITGGTGSLGQALTERLLREPDTTRIRIFARNELKLIKMEQQFPDERMRFIIGDIREHRPLQRAMQNIDVVIHTAALKHVDLGEYSPHEFIKTNVYGSMLVIEAAIDNKVPKVLTISTDKAVNPINLYGSTKKVMEHLFMRAHSYGGSDTNFSIIRYGNVFGSNGSIIPLALDMIRKNNALILTNPEMTRFSLTIDQAVEYILLSLQEMTHQATGTIYIPQLKAYQLGDLIHAFQILYPDIQVHTYGTRPGEKIHEELINKLEIPHTFQNDQFYITQMIKSRIPYNPITLTQYSSDIVEKYTIQELCEMIQNYVNQNS